MNTPDPIELTRQLIRINTVNPPGNEARAVERLAPLLSGAGFDLQEITFEPGRTGLVATLKRGKGPYLCFSGHLDTVPVGEVAWEHDPFAAEVDGDRLYGRGSADMKGGVAAITSAAIANASDTGCDTNLLLAFSPAEETLCDGARAMTEQVPLLREVGALVVAEPTTNTVRLGHKGALWLELSFEGVSAHGSMPALGRNAVHAAASAVVSLAALGPEIGPAGPLGAPTLNVGTFHGGAVVNSVPDAAAVQLDIRTVPDFTSEAALELVRATAGPMAKYRIIQSLPPVYTDEDHPWLQRVFALARATGLKDPPQPGLSYFTDAGFLQPACNNAPTVFIGPGAPDMAHQTDEWCSISGIVQARDLFLEMCRDFPRR